jgi:hypothetical protein
MPQRIRDYGVAALALGAVFAALTRIDQRVPAHVSAAMSDVAHGRIGEPGTPIGNVLLSLTSSPVLGDGFVLAMLATGVVLLLLMFRT